MDAWPNDAGFDTIYQELEPIALTVKGDIPYYAAGILYRTGPLGYKAKSENGKTFAAKHWFDGFSAVHRFHIDFPEVGGPAQVSYRSRRTVDEYLEHVRETGKGEGLTFASKRDPCESFFKKIMGIFVPSRDNRNVGVTLSIDMPGSSGIKNLEKSVVNNHTNAIQTLHAKSDHHMIKKIDPDTLEPQGIALQESLHPDLKGSISAAHAKSDPETGDIFNFNLEFGRNSTYRIFRTSAATGETDILANFHGQPAYIHSLFLTKNYVVLCVWNSHFTWAGISLLYHQNMVQAIAPFDQNSKATWYVVDRRQKRGLIATYQTGAFFCFHSINAWEEASVNNPSETDIITEFCLFENTDVIHRFYYDNLLSSLSGPESEYTGKKRLSCLPMHAQFRLPDVSTNSSILHPREAERLFLADKMISLELPTINPSYLTRRHRYTYGCTDRLKSSFMDGLAKFDNITQTSIFWEQEGHTPGEPIFLADPKGKEEDDGVLLTVVLDGYVERSYLLVLRARDLTEVGRAEVPGPVAFGFHGVFKGAGVKYTGDV